MEQLNENIYASPIFIDVKVIIQVQTMAFIMFLLCLYSRI